MTILPIVQFPDPRLRAVAEPVARFDDELLTLATDLLETMRAVPGIGITAPHLGVSARLVVLELMSGEVRTYVNPTLLWHSSETIHGAEGSVSMPGVTDEVERFAKVRVGYHDLQGVQHVEEADGMLSICLQHEVDQLDGIFWLQRLSRLKRDRLIARYNKLQRFGPISRRLAEELQEVEGRIVDPTESSGLAFQFLADQLNQKYRFGRRDR